MCGRQPISVSFLIFEFLNEKILLKSNSISPDNYYQKTEKQIQHLETQIIYRSTGNLQKLSVVRMSSNNFICVAEEEG